MAPGCNECIDIRVKEMMKVTKIMVEGEEGDEIKIFFEHPHSKWDYYFSGY